MMRLLGWLWPWVIVVVLAAALVDLAEGHEKGSNAEKLTA